MGYSRILVITDNLQLYKKFREIISRKSLANVIFTYKYSFNNYYFVDLFKADRDFKSVNIKEEWSTMAESYELIISLHSKQLFPTDLLATVKCINIHPGFNPFNRGWYPQVFSILNNLPLGATIHEMDEQLDHGPIIDQEEVPVYLWDTSLTAYERVIEAELRLIEKNIVKIVSGSYETENPAEEGNLNFKKDFDRLCKIDLNESATFRAFIDRLRALSHGDFKNAYFVDDRGRKIYLKLSLEVDSKMCDGSSEK